MKGKSSSLQGGPREIMVIWLSEGEDCAHNFPVCKVYNFGNLTK